MLAIIEKCWDSEFFTKKIGQIVAERNSSYPDVLETVAIAIAKGYDLIYLFSECSLQKPRDTALFGVWSLVDKKVIYQKEIVNPEITNSVSIFDGEPSTLYKLAYQAGYLSRFNVDPLFTKEDFRRFYREWVNNACNATFSEKVLVTKKGEIITGFTDIQRKNESIVTGLLAVDRCFRGFGYGKELLLATFDYAYKRKIKDVFIATQADNKNACAFYEHLGMNQCKKSHIYHIWNIHKR